MYSPHIISYISSVFDAIGKPASGILLGNLNWWGNYDLCIQLAETGLVPCKTSGLVPLTVSKYSSTMSFKFCVKVERVSDQQDSIVINKMHLSVILVHDGIEVIPERLVGCFGLE